MDIIKCDLKAISNPILEVKTSNRTLIGTRSGILSDAIMQIRNEVSLRQTF